MSLDRCIPGMVERGEFTSEQAADMGSLYGELHQQFRRQFGDQSAAAMATDATLRQMTALAARKRMLAGRAITAQKAMLADIATYNGGRGIDGDVIDPRAVRSLISGDDLTPYSSVDGRRAAIERRAFGMISGMLQQFHTDVWGRVRHVADLTDVLRAHWGEKVDNVAASELAQSLGRSFEYVRTRFNAAGGDIGTLPGGRGYLPQNHDWLAVRRAGFENWRAAILPELDRAAMIDRRTGMAFSDEALELTLRDVFETIRTDGWDSRVAGAVVGGGMTANRRGDPRFLIFRTADGWMRYNDAFGRNSPWDAIMLHIRSMSRDIAAMERFGPNPEHGVRWIRDTMMQRAARASDDGTILTKAEQGAHIIDRDWAEYTGANRLPVNQTIAAVGRGVRAYATAAKMGSALLSAGPGDIATQHIAAAYNRLPATRIMAHQLTLLNPANAEHRRVAASMGLILDNWTDRAATAMRAMDIEMEAGRMGRVANTVLRAQGLGVWTDTGRAAFGMTLFEHMGSMADRRFNQLDTGFADMLARNGIDAPAWERLRTTPLRETLGNRYLVPEDVSDPRLGDRILEMVHDEQRLAVQVADFRTRAFMAENLRPGTAIGEVARTSLLFKSFGVSMLMMHGQRMAAQANWRMRASYGVRMLTTLTLMGAVGVQLREIAKGRDPRPMDDAALWSAATLQGGGFGSAGDVLNVAIDPNLNNVGEWLGGPVAESGNNLFKMGNSAVRAMAGDESANPGRQLVRTLQAELPGGNLWYSRLVTQRLLLDQLQSQVDPDYADSWARMERRAEEQRTGYYWAPGDTSPDRTPDIMNAVPDDAGDQEEWNP